MLALDSTMGCIEASESEVLDLYRSAPMAKSSSQSPEHGTLEAYVCAIKKKTQIRVYLAVVADDQKIFVYTPPGKAESESGYRQSLEQAMACARSMGFSLQPVDLSYSPAMREVVVRNTKILRAPGSKAGPLKHGMPGAPSLPLPLAKADVGEPVATPPVATPVAAPATPIAPPEKAAAVYAEPGKVEQLERTIAELIKQLQALTAERDAQSARLVELTEQQQVSTTELSGARQEYDRLKAERDGLARFQQQCEELGRELGPLQETLRELWEQHQCVLRELSVARDECARREADNAALVQGANDAKEASARLGTLEQEIADLSARHRESERLCVELRDERAALAEALTLARQEVEAAAAEREHWLLEAGQLAQASREAGAKMDAALNELAALKAEKAETLQRVALLEQQKETAEQELVGQGKECTTMADLDAVVTAAPPCHAANAAAPPTASRAEPQPAAETMQPEAPEGATVKNTEFPDFTFDQGCAEQSPVEEHGAENSADKTCDDTVKAPLATQQSDREREFAYYSSLTEETTASDIQAPDFHPLEEQPTEFEAAPVAAHSHDFPSASPSGLNPHDFTPLADLHNDFFSASRDDSAPLRFLLAPELAAIAYSAPKEILELHQSINNANLAPDGKGQENCRGYVCGLKQGDSLLVFAAIHGTRSGRTAVYLPEDQPQDESSYASAIRGAISFAEEVGLMMEQVRLDSAAREDCIKKCPAFRETGHS